MRASGGFYLNQNISFVCLSFKRYGIVFFFELNFCVIGFSDYTFDVRTFNIALSAHKTFDFKGRNLFVFKPGRNKESTVCTKILKRSRTFFVPAGEYSDNSFVTLHKHFVDCCGNGCKMFDSASVMAEKSVGKSEFFDIHTETFNDEFGVNADSCACGEI